jgi:hypothetical protein
VPEAAGDNVDRAEEVAEPVATAAVCATGAAAAANAAADELVLLAEPANGLQRQQHSHNNQHFARLRQTITEYNIARDSSACV